MTDPKDGDIFRATGRPVIGEEDWVPANWPNLGDFVLVRNKRSVDLLGRMSWPEFNVHVGGVQVGEWV